MWNFSVTEGTWMNLDVSPDGKTIAFDLLGDIYTMPISGGNATCIRSGLAWEVQPRFSPDGKPNPVHQRCRRRRQYLADERRRLQGASGNQGIVPPAQQSLPGCPTASILWPANTSPSTRSLGAGEMWLYHISGGEGLQLTKRKNDQQDVNEPSVSPDGRYVYFSEDLYGGGFFQYNKDPSNKFLSSGATTGRKAKSKILPAVPAAPFARNQPRRQMAGLRAPGGHQNHPLSARPRPRARNSRSTTASTKTSRKPGRFSAFIRDSPGPIQSNTPDREHRHLGRRQTQTANQLQHDPFLFDRNTPLPFSRSSVKSPSAAP
jgi:hypothetical protein